MRIEYLNRVLLIDKQIAVLGDLHIGYEDLLRRKGVLLPRMQFKEISRSLEKIFSKIGNDKKIVILGDLKHEFSENTEQEWREVSKVVDLLLENSKKLILIKGNHDNYLGGITSRKGVELVESHVDSGILFAHGDKMISEMRDKSVKVIVLGHLHPAVTISDKYKREKFKCFLSGRWLGKKVIILPSFFPYVEGSEVKYDSLDEGKFVIPSSSLRNFSVHVVSDSGEILEFGKLKSLSEFYS